MTTSSGRLFRLTLTSTGGKYHLVSRLFARPAPSLSLSRLLPSFFGSSDLSPADAMNSYVSSIVLGSSSAIGEREVWVLVSERIQKWELKPEGWEELLLDRSVVGLLKEAVKDEFGIKENDDQSMDFELIDIGFEGYALYFFSLRIGFKLFTVKGRLSYSCHMHMQRRVL